MKRLLFLLLFVFFQKGLTAQIERVSFYFNLTDCSLTADSQVDLDTLVAKLLAYNSQVIELNAFTDISINPDAKAKCFADSILKQFPPQIDEPSLNIFGNEKVKLNFEVKNWNRVDVYCFIGEKKNCDFQVNYTGNENERDTVCTDEMEARMAVRIPPSLDNIEEGTPIVTPINFIGGKAKATGDSYIYMEYLKSTLEKRSDLSAHIRGHVCCGNNMKISKQRAKTVYKYLVSHGIDKSRLSYDGYSNTKPVAWPERTEEDRKANRRVDIIFTKTKPVELYTSH